MTETTTVKIPKPLYNSVKKVRAEIAREGVKNLPSSIRSLLEAKTCPFDYTQMEGDEGENYFYTCSKCGYSKQVFSTYDADAAQVLRMISISSVIDLGVAALIKTLKESK